MNKIILYITVIIICAAVYIRSAEAEESVIRWKDVPYSDGYIVEIRDSSGKTVVKKSTRDNYYEIGLPGGEYEFRLTVINRLGEPEASSDWKRFSVVKSAEPLSGKPEPVSVEPDKPKRPEKPPRPPRERMKLHAALMPSIFIPTGTMGGLFQAGAGIQAMAGVRELPSKNFETGISAGIYYLPGNESRGVLSMTHISYSVYSGYRINILEKYSVFPYAGAGFNHSSAETSEKYNIEAEKIINFSINAGITLARVHNNYYIPLGFAVDLLYDESEFIPCYRIYSGIGFMF